VALDVNIQFLQESPIRRQSMGFVKTGDSYSIQYRDNEDVLHDITGNIMSGFYDIYKYAPMVFKFVPGTLNKDEYWFIGNANYEQTFLIAYEYVTNQSQDLVSGFMRMTRGQIYHYDKLNESWKDRYFNDAFFKDSFTGDMYCKQLAHPGIKFHFSILVLDTMINKETHKDIGTKRVVEKELQKIIPIQVNDNIVESIGDFQKFDTGNLKEKDNSLNAQPIYKNNGSGVKIKNAIVIVGNNTGLDLEPYGMLAFYVSSYPNEEHWVVYLDYSLDKPNSNEWSPSISFSAINLVKGSNKKFEDYYDIIGRLWQKQEFWSYIVIVPKEPALDTNIQYRSFTQIHNIRNGKANIVSNFAKKVIDTESQEWFPPSGVVSITGIGNTIGGSIGGSCDCEIKAKVFTIKNHNIGGLGTSAPDIYHGEQTSRHLVLDWKTIKAAGIFSDNIVSFEAMIYAKGDRRQRFMAESAPTNPDWQGTAQEMMGLDAIRIEDKGLSYSSKPYTNPSYTIDLSDEYPDNDVDCGFFMRFMNIGIYDVRILVHYLPQAEKPDDNYKIIFDALDGIITGTNQRSVTMSVLIDENLKTPEAELSGFGFLYWENIDKSHAIDGQRLFQPSRSDCYEAIYGDFLMSLVPQESNFTIPFSASRSSSDYPDFKKRLDGYLSSQKSAYGANVQLQEREIGFTGAIKVIRNTVAPTTKDIKIKLLIQAQLASNFNNDGSASLSVIDSGVNNAPVSFLHPTLRTIFSRIVEITIPAGTADVEPVLHYRIFEMFSEDFVINDTPMIIDLFINDVKAENADVDSVNFFVRNDSFEENWHIVAKYRRSSSLRSVETTEDIKQQITFVERIGENND
jgi:hypothetical protein